MLSSFSANIYFTWMQEFASELSFTDSQETLLFSHGYNMNGVWQVLFWLWWRNPEGRRELAGPQGPLHQLLLPWGWSEVLQGGVWPSTTVALLPSHTPWPVLPQQLWTSVSSSEVFRYTSLYIFLVLVYLIGWQCSTSVEAEDRLSSNFSSIFLSLSWSQHL